MNRLKTLVAAVWAISLCGFTYAQDRGWPLSAVWNPDGKTIAVGSSTGVWFFDTGFNELGFVKTSPEEIIGSSLSLDWNASGDLLAVGFPGINPSGPIHIIDVNKLRIIAVIEYEEIYTPVRWHPEKNLILSGDRRGNTDVWDAVSGENVFHFEESDEQTAFAWNPTVGVCWLSGQKIAAITTFEVYIIDFVNGEILTSFDTWRPLRHADCNSEYQSITVGGNLVDFGTETVAPRFSKTYVGIGEWEFHVKYAVLSPDLRQIVTNEEGCRIRVIDAHNAEVLAKLDGGIIYDFANRYTQSISWHPDGSRFITVGQLGDIRVWDGQSYELIQRFDGFDMGDELAERLLPIFWDDNWSEVDVDSLKCLQEYVAIASE